MKRQKIDDMPMVGPGGQRNAPGDPYEMPGPQLINLWGRSCVENISLPNLERYFTNINMMNKDYANLQLVYFDFPANESLRAHYTDPLGPNGERFVRINVLIETENDFVLDSGQPPESVEPILQNLYYQMSFQLDINNVHIPSDLTEAFKIAMYNSAFVEKVIQPPNQISYAYRFFLNWFSDFVFDESTQKYAIVYSTPQSPLTFPPANPPGDIYIPYRFNVTMYGEDKGMFGKLFARYMGGTYSEDSGWKTVFNMQKTKWFAAQIYQQKKYLTSPPEFFNFDFFHQNEIMVYSNETVHTFIEPYVYIRGAPEGSVWNPDGTLTDILSVQPRIRVLGQPIQPTAFLSDQTHVTKTSIPSLKQMTLRFTDSEGNLLKPVGTYMIKLAITFD